MTKDRWGATDEEWTAWRALAAADLVPVVSNPHGEVSSASALAQVGKVPSIYNAQGKIVGLSAWPSREITAADLNLWSRREDYGICLITRNLRAIDIDSEDAALVSEIEAFIRAETTALSSDLEPLGDDRLARPFPVRVRSNSPRRLLLARVPGDLAKVIIRLPADKEQVEVLATGQQCIVAGTHTSGVRYAWEQGVPTTDQIPEFTPEEWDGLVRAINKRFGTGMSSLRSSLKTVVRGAVLPVDPERDPVAAFLLDERAEMVVGREPGKIHVRCPWADEHSDPDIVGSGSSWLVAGEAKDRDGAYLGSDYVCLHAHCADRGKGLFKQAIGALPFEDLTQVAEPLPSDQESWLTAALSLKQRMLKMSTKEVGRDDVAACVHNVALLIGTPEGTQVLGREFAWDSFIGAYVVRPWQPLLADGTWSPLPIDAWRPIAEGDQAHVRRVWDSLTRSGGTTVGGPASAGVSAGLWSSKHLTKPIGKDMVHDALHILADPHRTDSVVPRRTFDSAIQRMHTLRWDGVPRLEEFWIRHAGVPDTPYTRAVGRYTWTAMAARVLQPGVQADMAVLLLGLQGARKTSFFKAMCLHESWYATINLEDKEDDLIRLMRGKVVVEMEELRGLAGRDQQWTKAFITRAIDEWVPKYEEHKRAYARRNLFFGSGNEFHVLDDPTGERRYLPMPSGATDTDALLAPVRCVDPDTGEERWAPLRDLLWAEGVAVFKASGIQWAEAERLARAEHGRYKKANDHPWKELFVKWILAQLREAWSPAHPLEVGITTHEFLTNVVTGTRRDHTGDVKMVEKIMQVCGWHRTQAPGRVLGEAGHEVWMPPAGILGAGRRGAAEEEHPTPGDVVSRVSA